jgi:hypothetical protein
MQTWHDFRTEYEAAELVGRPALDRALWEIVADDLERLCAPVHVADVTDDLIGRFTALLIAEDVDLASLTIYLDTLRQAMRWTAGRGMAEAA